MPMTQQPDEMWHCLTCSDDARPARLIAKSGQEGVVDIGGEQLTILLDLVTDAQVGDWLLVHAGVAIAKWDEPPPDKVGGSEPSEKPTTEGA
jgi:hypothetical protein